MRRSRRLVISSIITVGNYEYGFYWYLYQDGTIEIEVKLTGILLTSAVAPGRAAGVRPAGLPGVGASHHQHFFNVRLDMGVDGHAQHGLEVHTEPCRRTREPARQRVRGAVDARSRPSPRPSSWSTRFGPRTGGSPTPTGKPVGRAGGLPARPGREHAAVRRDDSIGWRGAGF